MPIGALKVAKLHGNTFVPWRDTRSRRSGPTGNASALGFRDTGGDDRRIRILLAGHSPIDAVVASTGRLGADR